MPRLLQGGKASSGSLGNTDEDCLCNPDLSPAGRDTNSAFNYLLTDWCHLTAFNFCWGLHELLFRISLQLPIAFLHVTFTALSPAFTLNTDRIIDFLVCFFPKYFSFCILQLDPQRDKGILPNLQVSGSLLSLYNPGLNSLFSTRTPRGIAATGFSTEQGILGWV